MPPRGTDSLLTGIPEAATSSYRVTAGHTCPRFGPDVRLTVAFETELIYEAHFWCVSTVKDGAFFHHSMRRLTND